MDVVNSTNHHHGFTGEVLRLISCVKMCWMCRRQVSKKFVFITESWTLVCLLRNPLSVTRLCLYHFNLELSTIFHCLHISMKETKQMHSQYNHYAAYGSVVTKSEARLSSWSFYLQRNLFSINFSCFLLSMESWLYNVTVYSCTSLASVEVWRVNW